MVFLAKRTTFEKPTFKFAFLKRIRIHSATTPRTGDLSSIYQEKAEVVQINFLTSFLISVPSTLQQAVQRTSRQTSVNHKLKQSNKNNHSKKTNKILRTEYPGHTI